MIFITLTRSVLERERKLLIGDVLQRELSAGKFHINVRDLVSFSGLKGALILQCSKQLPTYDVTIDADEFQDH